VRSLGKDRTGESYMRFLDSLPYGSGQPLYTSGQDSWGQTPLEAGFVLYGAACIIFEVTA
jgi:hypothetical protein